MSSKKSPPIDFAHVHRIHFVGAGGTVVSALARILHSWGRKATGTDVLHYPRLEELARLGIPCVVSKRTASLTHHTDVVVVSPRIPKNHPDLILAKLWGIPILTTAEALGLISTVHSTIVVAGAHGKTTVAAFIGTLLERTGHDPTVIVRTNVDVWGGNVRCGKGSGTRAYFVTEADENQRRFLHLRPLIAVIMNIEADHLDYYKDLDAVVRAFYEFTHALPKDSTLIINADDPALARIIKRVKARVVKFGRSEESDVRALGITKGEKGASFTAHIKRQEGDLTINLSLPGAHQIYNALAVLSVARTLDLPLAETKKVLESYPGGKRHMEIVGEKEGVLVIDDAADHPAEIKSVLKGLRERYPDRKIWCCYQPYLENRTNYLMGAFAQSFTDTDRVFILPIVKGVEEGSGEASSQKLIEATQKYHPFVQEFPSREGSPTDVGGGVFTQLPKNSILLTLGADKVREVGERFL